ncbi:MAG: UbiA-like polyprenyltransferase [Planctomycetota bacterium]
MKLLARITDYGKLVRFTHTIFALPFAVMGAVLAVRAGRGDPGWWEAAWILVAMVGARTAAMAMNRLADHEIDATNPRTSDRELPSGRMGRGEVWALLAVSTGAFVLACGMLSPMTLYLSPVVIVVLYSYPYAKRFTWLCHLWLGAALGLSPVGAWVAVAGGFGDGFAAVLFLGFAVTLWTAGFDVLYALLDVEHDRSRGLHSIPSRLGVGPALLLSGLFHAGTVFLLVLAGRTADLGWIWWTGLAGVTGLLIAEHAMVKADDLSKVNLAFFTMNGAVSMGLMAAFLFDVWLA